MPVKPSPKPFTGRASARIQSKCLRKSKNLEGSIKNNQSLIFRVFKIRVGDRFHPRKFINSNQLRIHEGVKSNLATIRRLENEFIHYYCYTCKKPFTSKHNLTVHKSRKRHRHDLHKRL